MLQQCRIVELGLILLVLFGRLGLFLFGWFRSLFLLGLPDDSFLFLPEQPLKLVDILIIGQLILFLLVLILSLALLLEHSVGVEVSSLLVVPSALLIELEEEVVAGQLEADGLAGGVEFLDELVPARVGLGGVLHAVRYFMEFEL